MTMESGERRYVPDDDLPDPTLSTIEGNGE